MVSKFRNGARMKRRAFVALVREVPELALSSDWIVFALTLFCFLRLLGRWDAGTCSCERSRAWPYGSNSRLRLDPAMKYATNKQDR
eukprot:scaffold1237_cov243-Pinguiococcus_pyrenoidosus.AAC.31